VDSGAWESCSAISVATGQPGCFGARASCGAWSTAISSIFAVSHRTRLAQTDECLVLHWSFRERMLLRRALDFMTKNAVIAPCGRLTCILYTLHALTGD
jgi:hypothetical protein